MNVTFDIYVLCFGQFALRLEDCQQEIKIARFSFHSADSLQIFNQQRKVLTVTWKWNNFLNKTEDNYLQQIHSRNYMVIGSFEPTNYTEGHLLSSSRNVRRHQLRFSGWLSKMQASTWYTASQFSFCQIAKWKEKPHYLWRPLPQKPVVSNCLGKNTINYFKWNVTLSISLMLCSHLKHIYKKKENNVISNHLPNLCKGWE